MIKKPMILVFFLWVIHMPSQMAFGTETITIATHDYSPYYNSEGKGMLADIYTAAFDVVGIKTVYRCYPIERGVAYFFGGQVDAHSPGNMFFTPTQMGLADCVKTFRVIGCWFFYKPNQNRIEYTSRDSMKGYQLGVITKSPSIPNHLKHGLTVNPVQTPVQMVKKCQAGRDDFFETTLLTGMILVKDVFPDDWQNFDYIPWITHEGSLAFLKSNPRSRMLKRQFEKGFKEIKKNGTLVKILESYWGKGNIPKDELLDDMKSYGVTRFDANEFQCKQRNGYGKIIESGKLRDSISR